ncbi:MAG TPA: acyl-CoA thioester hydrolase/BAAT C-terminal domain-containing protein [Ktedonobacterales bacterium]|nr:acyl-CoA thioester hydrolase/BAAT C-terminal domain-containing protein [Ktedonobacterales bacterium]
MELVEQSLDGAIQGVAVGPVKRAVGPVKRAAGGVIVLAGSSGRVDVARARLLAQHRAIALALRWFGGPGQSPGICEIPLETFTSAVDWLMDQGVKRVGLLGLSKGAEAALLTACYDARIGAVVAISPSSVAWANVGAGADGQSYPYRSSWTWQGAPLPFVPYDESRSVDQTQGPVAYRALYEQSLAAFPERALAAAIPIERTAARILLIAGGDDEMWPSASFAGSLAERARAAGRQIEVIAEPRAGHRPPLPGEPAPLPSRTYRYGGSPEADAALGAAAWPRVLDCLGLPR